MSKTTKKKRKKPGESAATPPAEPIAPPPEADEDVVDAQFDEAESAGGGEPAEPAESTEDEAAPAEEGAAEAAREADEEEAPVATQLGAARWVSAGFFALWLLSSYVLGQALAGVWSWASNRDFFTRNFSALAAIPHEGEFVSRTTISLLVAGLLAGGITLYYFRKPSVRGWADEVADELRKVTWPVRKEVWENTIVVIAVAAVLTVYLMVLDRFWGFITNLIYSTGA